MAPRRTTRSTADQETVNATTVTNAQLQAMIDQGVTAALAARDALRSTNGDDSHNSGIGTEGVASLSQWCERMESVFHISNCAAENQVKFATCTLHSVALTWTFSEEADKIEKYVGGLPDMIHGSVVASKPKTMQEAIEIATELMDKKIRTFAERETASKRKNNAPARVYAVVRAGTDPDANVVTEDPYVEVALQAPPSLNYIPGPDEPEQAPPSPDYVPGPEHANNEIVAKDQPYAKDASPITQSPEYVLESDFEAHPEDDDDEDPEEDHVDYPADGGDDGDDEEESSKDDEDDEMDIEADEEEEHPAPADSLQYLCQHGLIQRLLDNLLYLPPPASPLSPWSSPPLQILFP
nr:reverse transcriptase domain-containing protein [Tanacetum cinerariifolium]